MATKKATAPTFSGPPASYTGYNPAKTVVVTVVPRQSGGYGVTPTYASTKPPASYSGVATFAGATGVAPPVSGAFSSPVASPYVAPPAPSIAAATGSGGGNIFGDTVTPTFSGPPVAYSQPGGADSGVNPFSVEGVAGMMYNPDLGAGKVYAAQSTNIPVNTAPTPVIVNGAVDYNNMVPTGPSNQDVTRVTAGGQYHGPIIGFNPDGTPMYGETDWYSTHASAAPQGTTGITPPLAYSTPPGTTETPWEHTANKWTQDPWKPEEPIPPTGAGGNDGGGGYGGWGGGYPDYGGYASSMGLFNWRIGL